MITGAQLQALVTANTTQARADLIAFAGVLDKVHAELQGMKPTSDQVLAGLLKFEGVKQATQAVIGMGRAAVDAYASNERLALSLQSLVAREKVRAGSAKNVQEAMKQSAAEAQKLLEWNQRLAIQSPFSQEGVAQAFKMAQSYGFVSDSADKTAITAKRVTQAMIDFASGSGQTEESMGRIALALGQIQAKGKLSGEEVLQLTEAGLNVRDILSQAFGKSTEEIVKMQERGLIPANKAIKAIIESLEKDFGGAAKAQAGTISGLLNSLQDIQQVAGREFFGGAIKAIQPQLQALTDYFGSPETIGQIREWGNSFGEAVAKMVPAFTKLGQAAVGTFSMVGGILTNTAGMIGAIPQPIYDWAIPAFIGLGVAIKGMATAQAAASVVTGVLTGTLALNTTALAANAMAAIQTAAAYGSLALAAGTIFIAAAKYSELRQQVADATGALLENNSAWQQSEGALARYNSASEGTKQRIAEQVAELNKLRDAQKQDISNTGWNSLLTGQVGEGDMQRLQDRQAKIEELSAAIQVATMIEQENGAAIAARAGALAVATQYETAAAQAASNHAAMILQLNGAAAEDIIQKGAAAEKAKILADMQEKLAELASALVSGHMTEAGAVAVLAQQYGLTTAKALELFRAQMLVARGANAAGIARLEAQGQATTDNMGGNRVGSNAPGRSGNSDAQMGMVLKNIEAQKQAEAAERAYAEAIGGTSVQLKNLRKDLANAQKGSADYYRIQTQIAQLEGRTAGSGAARTKAESDTQDKIREIAEDAAERLVEIDRRAAEQRAAAYKALANTILVSSADMVAQQEANDLELAGMNEEQLRNMAAREQAEAEARRRQAEIVQEARARAAEGDAELAQKEYDIQSEYNQKRQALDQEYYEQQKELAGDPEKLAILDQQYQEALAAMEQAEQIRLELARAAAEEAKAKAEEEKQAVIAAANEKMAAVKGASAETRASVISDLEAQASATGAYASAWEGAASRVVAAAQRAAGAIGAIPSAGSAGGPPAGGSSGAATGGGSSPTGAVAAAGGGRFLTRGLTTIIAGDNPGGVELVTVTPISGRGTTRVSGNVIRMAGGGEAILEGSEDTNPALARQRADAAAGGESRRRGWGAEEDRLYAQRLARLNQLERDYLFQKERMNREHFWKNLEQDEIIFKQQREVRRYQEEQTKRLDAEQEARAQAILKEWTKGAATAEQVVERARAESAARTARALALGDARMGERRNAALLAQQQRYQTEALKIVAEGENAQSDVESFWQTVRLADLSAANDEARARINAEHDRELERELERIQALEDERSRAEEDAADERGSSLEEQARELAEREFQGRRDALEVQQWRDNKIWDSEWDRRNDQIDAQLKQVVQGFEDLWKNMFIVAAGDMGEERYGNLQKRASGGPFKPGPMLVGEEGPELVWAQKPGYVSNAAETRGMLGTSVHIAIDARGSNDPRAVEEAGYRGAKRALRELGVKTESAIRTGGRR